VKIGARIAPSLAGLPSNRVCVSRAGLFLRLKQLARLHRGPLARVDVFLNGKLVVHEGGRLANVRLKRVPRHRRFIIEVVITTKRGYHLIATRTYRGC
jgi:hypothetical protein